MIQTLVLIWIDGLRHRNTSGMNLSETGIAKSTFNMCFHAAVTLEPIAFVDRKKHFHNLLTQEQQHELNALDHRN